MTSLALGACCYIKLRMAATTGRNSVWTLVLRNSSTVISANPKPLDHRLVGLFGQPHGVMDVDAAATSTQSDLGPPQADTSAVGGHHPHRLVGPALDDWKAQVTGIELLGRGQVALLQHQLTDSADRDRALACHRSLLTYRGVTGMQISLSNSPVFGSYAASIG